jgi:hypothetical protein
VTVVSSPLRVLARLNARTPPVLRPQWVVVVIIGAMLVAQLAAIGIYRITGESRTVSWLLLGSFGAFGSIAAFAFGIGRLFVPSTSRLRPWILGFVTSAAFWVSGAITVQTAIQSSSDLVALLVIVLISTWLIGYLLSKQSQSESDA